MDRILNFGVIFWKKWKITSAKSCLLIMTSSVYCFFSTRQVLVHNSRGFRVFVSSSVSLLNRAHWEISHIIGKIGLTCSNFGSEWVIVYDYHRLFVRVYSKTGYRISANSCRDNYSFLESWVRQLFKGDNYSKEETIVFFLILEVYITWIVVASWYLITLWFLYQCKEYLFT